MQNHNKTTYYPFNALHICQSNAKFWYGILYFWVWKKYGKVWNLMGPQEYEPCIWFWLETEAAEADANYIRIRKQSKSSAYSQQSGPISHNNIVWTG